MILYHGSNQDIKEIDLTKTRPNKDFGQGFYLTADKEQAMQMAKQKVVQSGGTPTVNVYEFDENHLSDNELNIKIFEGYTEEWAKFILANRNRESKIKIHDFDIVIGAIADDKVGVQLFRYMKKYICTFLIGISVFAKYCRKKETLIPPIRISVPIALYRRL